MTHPNLLVALQYRVLQYRDTVYGLHCSWAKASSQPTSHNTSPPHEDSSCSSWKATNAEILKLQLMRMTKRRATNHLAAEGAARPTCCRETQVVCSEVLTRRLRVATPGVAPRTPWVALLPHVTVQAQTRRKAGDR